MASIAAILAIVVLGVPLAAYLLQDRLLFHPQAFTEAERAAVLREFPFAREIFLESADGARLHAWHVPAEAGAPSEVNIKADALRWHDYAASLAPKRINVFGRSLGTGAAVYVASQRAVAGVVLSTPYDSMIEVARHHYPFLPASLLLRHRFESIDLAPRIAAPLLCIAAQHDTVVPSARARKLFEAWGGKKRWLELEGAGHNSTDGIPMFWESIRQFLQESGT